MTNPENVPPPAAKAPLRDLIIPVLSLVVGVLVLLPTAIGPVVRPFRLGTWFLPMFALTAFVAVVALVTAMLASSATTRRAPAIAARAHGIGNFSSVLALLAITSFLGWNYLLDGATPPRILNVKINPVQPETGKMVEVEAEVLNRSGRSLRFDWEFDGRPVAGMRTAYVKMPLKAGAYPLIVAVRNDEDAQSTGETGATSQDRSTSTGLPPGTTRIWLNVADGSPTLPTANAGSAPQGIIQICNGGDSNAALRSTAVAKAGNHKQAAKSCGRATAENRSAASAPDAHVD